MPALPQQLTAQLPLWAVLFVEGLLHSGIFLPRPVVPIAVCEPVVRTVEDLSASVRALEDQLSTCEAVEVSTPSRAESPGEWWTEGKAVGLVCSGNLLGGLVLWCLSSVRNGCSRCCRPSCSEVEAERADRPRRRGRGVLS